jgi:lysophospholipase L1-like esterase
MGKARTFPESGRGDIDMKSSFFFSIVLGAACLVQASGHTQDAKPPNRWESAIQQFEARDREQAPPSNGILFTGSSSIRMWDLDRWFPDLPVLNRGFGGSAYSDLVLFADRIVFPYKPRMIVLYSGDNDIAGGKTAAEVFETVQTLLGRVRKQLPETRIAIIAIKPSIARWKLYDEIKQANTLIKAACEADDQLVYVDIETPMLGEDGLPQKDLFLDDGLHLNDAGYALWTELLKPHLQDSE